MSALDVEILGSWGLYTITPLTTRAKRWARKHLSKGERTHGVGNVICEGGDRCRDIVRGLDRDGLRVEVNGVDMRGFGGGS